MAAPLYSLEHGSSPAAVGTLLAMLSASSLVLAVPSGRLCDRHGLRLPLGLAVAASTGSSALAAAWPCFATLCVAALSTGAACGLASIALQRAIGKCTTNPQLMRQAFSWLALGPALANALGPLVAGFCIEFMGWREAFLVLAVLPLGAWIFVKALNYNPAGTRSGLGQSQGAAWRLLLDPSFKRLMVVNWVLQACWDTHAMAVPMLAHKYGFNASQTSYILASFAAAATAVRALLPLATSFLSEWVVFTGVMVCTTVCFAVLPFLQSVSALVAVSAVLGFILGGVQPMAMSTLRQVAPADRYGEALGLRLVLLNATSTALPVAAGLLGASVGISVLFWAMGALAAFTTRTALAMRS